MKKQGRKSRTAGWSQCMPRRRAPVTSLRDAQGGQVMPMTVIFIAAVLLALFVMYDSGALMGEKIRLQNTADNVAYSTAALVSRDLNFIAYTNRGMAANHVGIGQMVGLSAWAAMIEQTATNLDHAANVIPPVKAVSVPFRNFAAGQSTFVDEVIAKPMITMNEWALSGLSSAQSIFHVAVLGAIGEFSTDIAQRNDDDAQPLLTAGNYSFLEAATIIDEWNEQVGSQYELHAWYDESEEARLANRRYREFEKTVVDSRDPFTARRSYNWGAPFSNPLPGAPGIDWRARKYGGSELRRSIGPGDKYKWDWAAADTVGMYYRWCYVLSCTSWAGDLPWPIGWGAAHALHEDTPGPWFDYTGRTSFPGRKQTTLWGDGIWKNPLAAANMIHGAFDPPGRRHDQHAIKENLKGLRGFYDFREDGSEARQIDAGPPVIALYVKADGVINSQRQLFQGAPVPTDFDVRAHDDRVARRIGAVAKAEPYFSRPTDLTGWARADRRYEHGNLYNPYWQPRLVDLTSEEKLTAAAMVAGGIDFGGVGNDE